MPKASSYKIDTNVTFKDIIFGSDGDNSLKTKNFTIESLLTLLDGGDSIKTPLIKTIVLDVDTGFQQGLQANSLTVLPSESPVIIQFIKEERIPNSTSKDINKYLFLFPLGAGTYDPISDSVSLGDLLLINTTKPSVSDVQSLPNSVVYDLGNLTNQDFIQIINGTTPSYNLSNSSNNYFFKFFDNGSERLFKFVGINGVYGANDLQSTDSDFIEFTSQVTDNDDIRVAKQVIQLPQTSYTTEANEISDVVSKVNSISPLFSVTDQEIYIVEANELENDAEEPYKSLYLITTGKGSYGSGGKQISSDNVIKIRGEQINKKLSSFTNDAGFSSSTATVPTNVSSFNNDVPYASEAYVNNLVSFRGEFDNTNNISSISEPSSGDYATINTADAKQLWVYIDSSWNLISAEHSVLTRTSNFSINNLLQNKTIILGTGTSGDINITLPTTVIDGIEVYIKNDSAYEITLSSTGTIEGETKVLPDRAIYITKKGTTFYTQVNEKKKGEDIELGLYLYDDTQPAQTLSAGVFSDLSNNGAGVNTYKDPLDILPNAYNVSTDRFDFTGLEIGDIISISLSGDLTTTSTTQVFDAVLVLGLGSANEQRRPFFSSKYFRDAGTYTISEFDEFFVSSSVIRDNPAKIEVKTSGASSIDAVQLKIKIIKRL